MEPLCEHAMQARCQQGRELTDVYQDAETGGAEAGEFRLRYPKRKGVREGMLLAQTTSPY